MGGGQCWDVTLLWNFLLWAGWWVSPADTHAAPGWRAMAGCQESSAYKLTHWYKPKDGATKTRLGSGHPQSPSRALGYKWCYHVYLPVIGAPGFVAASCNYLPLVLWVYVKCIIGIQCQPKGLSNMLPLEEGLVAALSYYVIPATFSVIGGIQLQCNTATPTKSKVICRRHKLQMEQKAFSNNL